MTKAGLIKEKIIINKNIIIKESKSGLNARSPLICKREEEKDTQKFQENIISYRRQMLKEGERNIGSYSFPSFPFLSFFPLLNCH